jgi:cysteine synthase
MSLRAHPFLEATDPSKSRLIRVSQPFPAWLNPFHDDGVVIRAGAIPGEVAHSKSYMARELIISGIERGAITADTTIVEASSGNTGQAIASICNALCLKCQIVLPGDTPTSKINVVRAMGRYVEPVLHFDRRESVVSRARREGAQAGHYNPDQYANPLNPLAHETHLAPQLIGARGGEFHLIAAAAGTMGTCLGLKTAVNKAGLPATILPVLCAEGEEVPGARSLAKIRRDVKLPWEQSFTLQDIEFGPRHESFLLAYLSWRWIPQMLGPSFGLALFGALKRLWKDKKMKRLNAGLNVLVLGADSYVLYPDIIVAEIMHEEFSSDQIIKNVMRRISESTNECGVVTDGDKPAAQLVNGWFARASARDRRG